MTADDEFTVPAPDPTEPMDAVQSRPLKTWYRSLKGGKVWCESSDPDEVAASGGDTLEVLRYYAVTSGWRPWNPSEIR